jgi:hypothetical protein
MGQGISSQKVKLLKDGSPSHAHSRARLMHRMVSLQPERTRTPGKSLHSAMQIILEPGKQRRHAELVGT